MSNIKKILLSIFAISITMIWYFSPDITLDTVKTNLVYMQKSFADDPLSFYLKFSIAYIGVSIFALPGASLLTLLAGNTFGTWLGFIAVSIISTIGASLSFLISRYFFNDYFQNKFKSKLEKINEELENQGSLYVIFIRLAPIFPFFIVNNVF